ncbi:MAG: GGDEF domain-containing protein [Sulfurimonadaceae bacterium]|jgi:diguanylate cyclase (GGDEF)-like protein|nr:GGDEF domain-containing protein [Sulfurimonadaceae bacterium]
MSGSLRSRKRRVIGDEADDETTSIIGSSFGIEEPSSDIELYSKEVLNALIKDNLPPTPNNFSLYFDRLLEEKSEHLRKQIISILELEEGNNDENTVELEQTLKKGFSSIKNILTVTANLYKNVVLMSRILDKRKEEFGLNDNPDIGIGITKSLREDVEKLNTILKKQTTQMRELYDETAGIVKTVENETIFDNKFGVYNKRYLLTRIEQEIGLIKEFRHRSSLIMIELDKDLRRSIKNEKSILLTTRTLARLLLKTSRRSDTVAHYGNGVFSMLLKHTDIESAKKASERLCDLVANSNFFLADQEVQLKISIGITDISVNYSVEEIVVSALDGIEQAYAKSNADFAVSLRKKEEPTPEA